MEQKGEEGGRDGEEGRRVGTRKEAVRGLHRHIFLGIKWRCMRES